MLKLYGFPISHYYNMVKHTLLTKGVEFEGAWSCRAQVRIISRKALWGRYPALRRNTVLSETSVILDYLETRYPQTPLSPPITGEDQDERAYENQ